MHKELAKDGLVVLSLSIDETDNKDAVLAFLKKVEASFPNFLLVDTDENHEKNEKEFPTNTPPLTHVFDQTGKKVKTFKGDEKDEEIEAFVRELLKKQ